jgi:hypothetical protein
MKRAAYISISIVMAMVFLFPCQPVCAQSLRTPKFPGFDIAKAKISESEKTFIKKYTAQRNRCRYKAEALEQTLPAGQAESFSNAAVDFANCVKELRNMKDQMVSTWQIVYTAHENPDSLLSEGWNQKQVDAAKTWSKKFWEMARATFALDNQYPTSYQLDSLLLRASSQPQ